jgi:hypothetical protein
LDTGLHASDLESLKLENADMNSVNAENKHDVQEYAVGGKGRIVFLVKPVLYIKTPPSEFSHFLLAVSIPTP